MGVAAIQNVLLNAVTSGSSASIDVAGYRDLTIYLSGAGTISSGTLIIEEAAYDSSHNPPATWSTVTAGGALDCTEVSGGKQKAYQLPPGAYAFIKARIGTSIGGGGTLTVFLVGL